MNEKLRQARIDRRWSVNIAARRIGIGRTTYMRWEQGTQTPHDSTLMLACKAFNLTPEQLGFGPETSHVVTIEESIPPIAEKTASEERATSPERIRAGAFEQTATPHTFTEEQEHVYRALLKIGEAIVFNSERRETLQTLLAALSLVAIKPQGLLQAEGWHRLLLSETSSIKVNEEVIQGYTKLIEACWQLSRGNELALAEKLLPECMNRLVPLAQQPSTYQTTAAYLAAQGFKLYSIFALHQNNLPAMKLYGKQAVQYCLLSEKQNALIPMFKGLGATYYYNKQPIPMLQTYENALQYTQGASPLLQAAVYMGLAVAYAHINQHQESLRYLGLATDMFPDHPETDASFVYAEFDASQMILWEGISRTQLGQFDQALEVFGRIEQTGTAIPERVRIEVINHRAKTAIVSGELEKGVAYIEAGTAGAKALGSQRRLSEAYDNFNQMALLWPQENRVKELAGLFE